MFFQTFVPLKLIMYVLLIINEIIRPLHSTSNQIILPDKKEKYYNSKFIWCYMFRVDGSFVVVDATMKSNTTMKGNHSCDMNIF